MNLQSVNYPYSPVYTLDEILRDTLETPTEELTDIEGTYQIYIEELNIELKAADKIWVEFHAGQCEQYGKVAKSILYRIVKASVGNPENSVAAANAITILKVMKISFSCLDLRGVQIPGADLSNAILDSVDFSDANLENVSFANASLNYLKLSNANLNRTKFETPEALIHEGKVWGNVISFDGKYLFSEGRKYIYLWDIPSRVRIGIIEKLNDSSIKKFTSDGRFLFIYDYLNIDIYSTKDCKHINKIPIPDIILGALYMSSNSFCFITLHWYEKGKKTNFDTKKCLKVWEIQETKNADLEINIKEEFILYDRILDICFSKKFPVIYCLKIRKQESKHERDIIDLCIYTLKKPSEIAKMQNIVQTPYFKNIEKFYYALLMRASITLLDTLDQSKECKETLLIEFDRSIYSATICKKSEQSFSLAIFEPTKIIDETASIHNMRVLSKTQELIYVCNDTICLYSLLNNQYIGRYRLYDTRLVMPISFDDKNMFINDSNRISIYSLEALRNNKHISYELNCGAVCFSPNKRTIITISESLFITEYDIETRGVLKSNMLKRISSNLSRGNYKIFSSSNSNSILILSWHSDNGKSYIINAQNEELYLEEAAYPIVLSNNSEYAACINFTGKLRIYKIIPLKQCIGEFSFFNKPLSRYILLLSISTDFCNIPRIAFIVSIGFHKDEEVILCYFRFEGQTLALEKVQRYSIVDELNKFTALDRDSRFLQMQFIHDNNELILIFKYRIVFYNLEQDIEEQYEISAECASISQDGALLIYYGRTENNPNERILCLWSVTQKKDLIVQPISQDISKLQISPDNRYIIGTVNNGGMYVWKIIDNTFRLLWRTTHNLQTQGLILDNTNLEKDIEDDIVTKIGAIKL